MCSGGCSEIVPAEVVSVEVVSVKVVLLEYIEMCGILPGGFRHNKL